ncbi:MAG TPA: alkaline phosphatase family protein [Candidatus Methanoperedens sp.]|nr:alkaline phosphatase family protein [Candidatus Methanoperedens sp.]
MRWFPARSRAPGTGRTFVLSLDGVPHSFLLRHLPEGAFPHLSRLFAEGELRPLATVRPPVSTVVWTSYATGVGPGRHGVYGLIERRPGGYDLFVPGSGDVQAPTLWESLGRAGKTSVVVNVPGTWPPRAVRGVLIAPARAATLEEIVFPHSLGPFLRGIGYRLDVDARAALAGNKDDLLADLDVALRARFEAALSLLLREPWDFFQLHVSETDRLNHFLWDDYERDAPGYGRAFLAFYRRLDAYIGELVDLLPRGAELLLLSGNGFTRLRREVNLNRVLEELGWLEFLPGEGRRLSGIAAGARAYSLAPGRVYLHLKGREPRGTIAGREEYRAFRDGIAADLLRFTDPENGRPLVAAALRGEEVNGNPAWPPFPLPASARLPAPCDLLLVPAAGCEIRGHLDRESVAGRPEMAGTHAWDDAFIFVRGRRIRARAPRIVDVCPTVLQLMGVPPDERRDGCSLV